MKVEAPIHLRVEMPLFSKARPRLGRDRKTGQPTVHMPGAYRTNQTKMRMLLRHQWKGGLLEGPLCLYLRVGGEGRGDLDNIAGAFMDAAADILWKDDRCGTICELAIQWEKKPKAESYWDVTIRPPFLAQLELPLF